MDTSLLQIILKILIGKVFKIPFTAVVEGPSNIVASKFFFNCSNLE
jgi:hypothetical protein